MPAQPPIAAGRSSKVSLLGKICFVLGVALICLCEYLIIDYRQTTERAITGELVTGTPRAASGHGFIGALLDYFGTVTYILPFLGFYIWCKVLLRPVAFRQIDFFKVGVRFLGFNLLVLGLCPLFSGLFAGGDTGAGGILGDFLNLIFFKNLPAPAAALLPLILTLSGLVLFTATSPLWYCEKLGAALCFFWPFKHRAESDTPKKSEQSAPAESTAADTPAPAAPGEPRVQPHEHNIEPTFGNMNLGGAGPGYAAAESTAPLSETGSFTARDDDPPLSYSPQTPLNFQVGGEYSRDQNAYPKSAAAAKSTAPESSPYGYEPEGPSRTVVQVDPRYSAPQRQTQQLSPQEAADEVSTIIKDSRLPEQEAQDETPGQHTLITKHEMPPAAPAEEVPVYEAGAPGVQSEVVGNPERRRDAASTVITRGDNAVSHLQFGENVSLKTDRPADSPAGSYDQQPPALHLPVDDSTEENIISFTDLGAEREVEVDALTSAFIPQNNDDSRLAPASTELVSERERNFFSLGAVRGINGTAIDETQSSSEGSGDNSEQSAFFKAPETHSERAAETETGESAGEDIPWSAPEEDAAEDSGWEEEREAAPAAEVPESLTERPATLPPTSFPTKDYIDPAQTAPQRNYDSWRPDISLLASSDGSYVTDQNYIEEMTGRIDRFMAEFKVKAHVADRTSGPVITRYDLQLDPGTRFSQMKNLGTDMKRRLMVKNVRMLEVVPGTAYVGLEVPNNKRQMITLRDVVEQEAFRSSTAQLPLCLGVNTVGRPVVADLARAPHLLVAGTTGSGKSAGINSMLISLLLRRSPAELRLILVDPKQVEFSLYENLPHLITPIITEVDQTSAALKWCIGEMERRYTLISNMKVHNMTEYNAIIRRANAEGRQVYDPSWSAEMGGNPPVLKTLPAIVMVIDEFADLMAMTETRRGDKNSSPEQMIARLTAKARAAAIHLVLATQSPRSNVVTGLIKANMPSRVAYTVQSALDSRIILDETGAENLLGQGDCIVKFTALENNESFRAHGPFTSNEDVKNIVGAWHDYAGDPEYLEGVADVEEEESESFSDPLSGSSDSGSRDSMYDQVAEYARDYCQKYQKAPSISGIQIQFGIGYTRAKRLVVQLTRDGVIDE